jgi:hypothetical protein
MVKRQEMILSATQDDLWENERAHRCSGSVPDVTLVVALLPPLVPRQGHCGLRRALLATRKRFGFNNSVR